jgi:hypothetical protein
MDTLGPMACPLRGNLGQTHYTRIRPTGERTTESVVFVLGHVVPPHVFAGYFRLFGIRAAEANMLPRDVLPDEVIEDDVLPMDGDPTLTALDNGTLVARQSFEAYGCVLRSWSL